MGILLFSKKTFINLTSKKTYFPALQNIDRHSWACSIAWLTKKLSFQQECDLGFAFAFSTFKMRKQGYTINRKIAVRFGNKFTNMTLPAQNRPLLSNLHCSTPFYIVSFIQLSSFIIASLFHTRLLNRPNLPFLQILPIAVFLFFFRTDSTDSPDCLPILLSLSVFAC